LVGFVIEDLSRPYRSAMISEMTFEERNRAFQFCSDDVAIAVEF
jgi:hypothetical protein